MVQLEIYASPLPFSNKQIKAYAAVGCTMQQIIEQICPPSLYKSGVCAVVSVNGYNIPSKHWSKVRPKANTVINVRLVPQGGGGKKSPLGTILSIAMIAAPYAFPLTFAAAAGATFGAAGFSYATSMALTRGVFSLVGSLLVNAIAPPPKQRGSGSTVTNPEESPTLFIEGASNAYNPFGSIPICLGTNRMVPPQAAKAFTESQGKDQFVRQLFTWGYGDQLVVSDIKIGETSISEFASVEMEHRLNGDLHLSTSLYTQDVFQDDYNVLVSVAGGEVIRTTQLGIDEAIVDLTFPQGLSEFNSAGKRISRSAQFELTYALTGESPPNWSPAVGGYNAIGSNVLPVSPVPLTGTIEVISGAAHTVGYRRDIVVIDIYSGDSYIVQSTGVAGTDAVVTTSIVPENALRISTVLVRTKKHSTTGVETTEIISTTDDRQPEYFTQNFENSGDFLVGSSGTDVTVAAGGITSNQLSYSESTGEAIRKPVRVKFPANGQYDIRLRRITADTASDQIFDKAFLTSIKSVKYQAPVNLEGINGTALRMKGTDQLTGVVDQLNALVSSVIPDYDVGTDTWIPRVTSNPASIFRFVMQGIANAVPLQDSELNLEDLKAWHAFCEEQGYAYNRVIDYEASIDDIVRDVTSAGAASPAIVDGKRTVVVDNIKEDIVQMITPRNSWDYNGELTYPKLPHAFRVQFRNAAKGYQQDERIVYDDGYNESNATIFESLELQYCTSATQAWKMARRYMASARLRPENHTFTMDVENLVALRGDRVKVVHDIPLVGVGDARLKSVILDSDSPPNVIGVTLDDEIGIPEVATYYMRIRRSDGGMIYKQIQAVVGYATAFNFTTPFPVEEGPDVGDLCYVVEAGTELDLIITRIEPSEDLTAQITAINYAPEIFTAEQGVIPSFVSNVTTPLSFIRPEPPVLVSAQSDESVMLRNSDGSYLPRAIFTLSNPNVGEVSTHVQLRESGTTEFVEANLLEASEGRVILTGLSDGTRYDIYIRYKRAGSNLYSLPLQINNYLFIGASGTPDDVQNFVVNILGESALFKWDANDDIDLAGYRIKFSGAYEDASWDTAQILENLVLENRVTVAFQGGTYLIKAVDLLGNESANPAIVITYNPGVLRNVVQLIEEDPDFAGTKDNVQVVSNELVLIDTDSVGYYYFDESGDLGGIYTSILAANIQASGTIINDLFESDDLFEDDDLFTSAGAVDLFSLTDMFAAEDLFGFGTGTWSIKLQQRTTNDDPSGSPVWSDWVDFTAGSVEFYAIEFRLELRSLAGGITPAVSVLEVTIDMPDRIEREEDLSVTAGGATITYDPAFKASPAVAITLQNAATDDRIEFTSKTASGFSFKVYNGTTAGYVTRTYDYIASGYGRQN